MRRSPAYRSLRSWLLVFLLGSVATGHGAEAVNGAPLKFDFGSGAPRVGFARVKPDMFFAAERGYGFEPD
ncbi:MAG TPA: hypothetical protein VFJ90_05695, partial [Candidatus Didemnitutus sp.]|nr:hypothetical protein [Candidatus Didemnitutus sp.]